MLLTVLLLVQPRATAQAGSQWYFENVSEGNLIPGCVTGMTLAGFEIDPQGRPALGWREENGCGGPPRVFWTRFDAGAWDRKEFLSERRFQGGGAADHSHQFSLRQSDGNPFFIYADAGQFNEINTYRSDVGAHPNGGVSTYLENIVGPQNCDSTNYSPAFGPNDPLPQWVTGFATCNGQGSLRLNGSDIRSPLYSPRGALAVTADGARHVLWNTGSLVSYSRFPFGATLADHEVNLIETGNRFGGEVKIAPGPDGVLHAIVRGPDATADWDPGAIVYLRSDDGGTSWSPFEYVDSNDDPSVQEPSNANSDVSLAIDPNGVPAVAFWRWNSELWYAKRDGPNGTWTKQLITALPVQNQARANQVRFDANGDPVVAFYDAAINEMRLARPVPAGVVFPIDAAVTVSVAPGLAPAGSPATFTIAVTNKGVTNLDRVELSNRLPYRTSLAGVVPPSGLDGRWVFPLVSGDTQTFTVHATLPLEEGTYVDVAEVSAGAEDANPADNSASAAVVVKGEQCFVPGSENDPACRTITGAEDDLSVTISALPGVVAPSGTASFAIGVTNLGPSARENVLVQAELSPGASLIDAAPIPSSDSGGITTYAVGSLASGETKWILVRATAPGAPAPLSVTARHLNGADANATNNQATAAVVVQADACFVPHADLIGRWRLDGNGNDDIAGRTAALRATTAFDVGQAGQALVLNGSAGYAEVADAAALRPAAFTISAWVNPSDMQNWNTVVAKGASGLDGNMVWYDDTYWLGLGFSGYPTLYTYHGFTQETRAQQPLTPGRWYHLAATFDGSVARVYVDGVQVAESTIDQPLYYDINPVPLTIGEDWQGGSAWGAQFVGSLDDVTLHGRALSAEDVAAMVSGSSSECVNHPPVAVDDVVDATVAGATANVVANDSDPDGDTVTIVEIVTPPSHGTASFSAQSITYTPNAFNAELDALTYRISDGRGGFATATLTIMLPVGTSTSLQSSPRPSARGAAVTLTAHVTALAGSAVGSVTFHNVTSNTPLGAASLVAGTAAMTVETLPPGTNLVRATYAPIGRFLPSSIEIEHVVIPVDDLIRNGDLETRSQYDAVGAIVSPGGSCSATLLSPTVALTAAQCVYNVPRQDLQFRIGADLSAAVATVLIHPGFLTAEGANLAFDVALVKLDPAAVAAWPAIGYPAIAEHAMTPGATGLAVGAASMGGSWVRASGSLLVTQYIAGEGPIGIFFGDGFIETLPATAANHMFCARGTGGPLFDADGHMTGVASFRFVATCAEEGPGYYINLDRLRNWITTNAGSLDDLIRNGDLETRSQYDAVGAIVSPGGSCSATLLSPTVALTAAQCVYSVPPQDLQFRIGADLSAAVAAVLVHPGFLTEDGANLAFDVALVKLDAAAVATWPAIAYPAIAEHAMTPGTTGTAVGAASIGGSWVRASGSLLVTQYIGGEGPVGNFFADGFIETVPATAANQMFCPRGHGGPLFDADGRMTGVASFRFVATCAEEGPGYYINLDRLRNWITTSAGALDVNDPPTLDPIADITVVAGQLATVPLANVTAGGPDEATQALEVIAISSDSAVTGPITYANGQVTFTPPFRSDTRSAIIEVMVREVLEPSSSVTRSFTVTVLGGGNTPPGSDVTVVNGPISVTFAQVIAGGETTHTPQAAGMAPPSGFAFGNPPVWYDISTSAHYVAPIVVCLTFAPGQFADPTAARLFHFEGGAWVDRTVSIDAAARTVCGSVSSLSPFGLFEPATPPPPPTSELEGRMHGQAGFTVSGVEYDVHFRIAERRIGNERGAINVKVTTPKIGNTKKRTDRFESTRIDDIVFFDDPAFRSGRSTQAPPVDSAVFSGIGKWNGAAGHRFEATATDQGEPGRGRDRFAITIFNAAGDVVAAGEATIDSGNIQSDRLRPEHWR